MLETERWQHEFQVQNTHALAQLFSTLPNIKYSIQGDILELFYTSQVITAAFNGDYAFTTGLLAHLPRITHPNYRDKVVYAKPSNRVFFGDGEQMSDEIVNELIDIHNSLLHLHRWEAGDILFIDNTRYLHGRTLTEQPCERVLLSRFGWLK